MEVGSFFQPLIDRFRTATLSDDDTSSSTAELVDALDDLDLAPEKVDASIQTDNPVSCDTAQPKNDEEAKPVLGTVITYIKDYNKQARATGEVYKLLSSNFHFSDSYLFDGKPICDRDATHEIALYGPSGKMVHVYNLGLTERETIFADINAMLLPRGIFKLRPIVSFLGPYVSVKTKDHFNLEATMELVEEKGKLGPYRTKFISKGLPFEPAFWIFRGIPKHLEMDTLSAEMHSYAVVHEKVLGKFRVIYASCVPSTDPFDDTPFFTGNILLVAEAKTIEYNVGKKMPLFRGVKPRRGQSADLHH